MYSSAMGDFVWNDLNRNDIQELGEPGIPYVMVNLYSDTNNLLATTTTNAGGGYAFFNLISGQYQIEFVWPSMDFMLSPANAPASNSTNDSNANSSVLHPFPLHP